MGLDEKREQAQLELEMTIYDWYDSREITPYFHHLPCLMSESIGGCGPVR